MAKNKSDIILRERLEFATDGNGNLGTLYGRIDLSDWVNISKREGLALKEIRFQLLSGSGGTNYSFSNTGAVTAWQGTGGASDDSHSSALKVFATTIAYENAADVGISSPSVYAVETMVWTGNENLAGGLSGQEIVTSYGISDLHPNGVTIINDLLIGVAADRFANWGTNSLILDVQIVAESKTISPADFSVMMAQAQDL